MSSARIGFLALESLESRQLLSLDPAAGTWSMFSPHGHGTVTLDGAGGITAGQFTDENGTMPFTNGSYTVDAGLLNVAVTVGGQDMSFRGSFNSAPDVISMTNVTPGIGDTGDQDILIRHDGDFSLADLSGSWAIASADFTGTVTLDAAGNITGGSVVDSDAHRGRITSGTYTLGADGELDMVANLTGMAQPQMHVNGYLNDSQDFAALNVEVAAGHQPGLVTITRHTGKFSTADLAGSWMVNDAWSQGGITFDGKGKITVGMVGGSHGVMQLSGMYSVAADGKVSATVLTGELQYPVQKMVGYLGTTRDFIAFTNTTRSAATSDDDYLLMLVNPAGADLAVSLGAAITPDVLVPGDKITIPVTITNHGNITAAGQGNITFSAGVGTNPGDNGNIETGLLSFPVSVNLAPGKSMTVKCTLPITADLQPGDYYVRAAVSGDWAETNLADNRAQPAAPQPLEWAFGQVGLRKNVKFTAAEADGTVGTFALSGPGTGTVTSEITGWGVSLDGTDSTSAMTVTAAKPTAPGDDGRVSLAFVNATGAVKSIAGKSADLMGGGMDLAGAVGSIQLNDIEGGNLINLISPNGGPVSFTFNQVADLSIQSTLPIAALTAAEYVNILNRPMSIQAPSLGKLTITGNKKLPIWGDFEADLVLGPPFSTAPVLGSASIAGDLANAHWQASGAVGSVTIGGIARDSQIAADGNVGAVKVGAAVGFDLLAGVQPGLRHAVGAADFAAAVPISIKSFAVAGLKSYRGDPPPRYFFEDSNLSAPAIGAVTLLNVDFNNAGNAFGLWADGPGSPIKSVAWSDTLDKTVKGKYPPKTGPFIQQPDLAIEVL